MVRRRRAVIRTMNICSTTMVSALAPMAMPRVDGAVPTVSVAKAATPDSNWP